MRTRDERYVARLEFWLRLRGMGVATTSSIVADVRSHLAESGENPDEAFGSPFAYAKVSSAGRSPSYLRGVAAVAGLAVLIVGCYLAASVVAHGRSRRPEWGTAPQWFVVVVTLVTLSLGWWILMSALRRPPLALIGGVDGGGGPRRRARRASALASVALLVTAVGVTSAWAAQLTHAYLERPRLQVAPYVFTTSTASSSQVDELISVRTVIYLDGPGPATSLNMATLSRRSDPRGVVTSSLQGFGSLAQALRVARETTWSINGDQVPGFTLAEGNYYVLTWTGSMYTTYTSSSPVQEYLVIDYLVAGAGLKTLRIPLSISG